MNIHNYEFADCTLCPRHCGADRAHGQVGFCRVTDHLKVARAALHMWEEPCISGEQGSGAVFFSGCSLRCCFCQNRDISDGSAGKLITTERLCDIFFELAAKGTANINLVTGDHYIPRIVTAIELAKARGFTLPFVFNCSGYESADMIRALDGYIDIYLTDFKYMSPVLSAKYSKAPDYAAYAKEALAEMVRQCGGAKTRFDESGIMQMGVIVRHLQLPDCIDDSKAVISYLYDTYGNDIYISIMNQYTPPTSACNEHGIDAAPLAPEMKTFADSYPTLCRKLTSKEYDELVDFATYIGVENGFIQEGETADESFIPPFDCEGV